MQGLIDLVTSINWESMSLFTNRTHVTAHSSLIDVMQEHKLEQRVN